MSHTPGPWQIDDDTLDVISLTAGDAPAYIACQPAYPAGRQLGEAEVKANVQLIAAAPDLLAAARLANQELIDLGQGSSGSPALVALWAAIAKAEGRE